MNIRSVRPLLVAVISLLLMSFSGYKASASHFAAGEIYLTYIGEGADGCSNTSEYKYLLEVNFYRACEQGSSPAPLSVPIQWSSANAGYSNSVTLNNPIKDTLNELCEAFVPQNSCIIPANEKTYPAYVRHKFIDTVILPSAQTDWKFSYSGCCRNGGIDNIDNPSTKPWYIETVLNNLTKYNNSSPRFAWDPLPYICAGQPASYLNGPYDVNNDSLYSVFQEPYEAQTTAIPYKPPYSLVDPVGSAPGTKFIFDHATATASFTPSIQGKFVLAFKCSEYERGTGVPLGHVYRDVQVSVFPCSAPPPAVDSTPPTISGASLVKINGKDGIVVCPGSNINFPISTESKSSTSNVYMDANLSDFPGAQFTTQGSGTNKVTGEFKWTPTITDIGEKTLIVTAKDSTCSGASFAIVLKNYTVILIKVVPGLDAGPDLPICEIGGDSVQLYVRGADAADSMILNWSVAGGGPVLGLSSTNIHNPKAKPNVTTDYIVSAPQLTGSCKSKDTVSVYIDETNGVTITPKNPVDSNNAMVLCRPGYVQLEALLKGRPPKNNVPCGTGSPTICSNPDTTTIYGSSVYGNVAYDSASVNAPYLFTSFKTSKQQYLIRREDMEHAGVYSATIRSIGFETIDTSSNTGKYVYANFRISIKCTDKESLSKDDGFENFGMTQVYSAPTVTFPNGMHHFTLTTPYNWDTTKNIIIQMCYSDNPKLDTGCGNNNKPPLIPYVPTTYVSGLRLIGATPSVTSVCGVSKSADITSVSARPAMTFSYCEADPLPFDITWLNGEYMSDSTILQPLTYVPKTSRFVVQTIGRSNCLMRDTLDIYVPEHDMRVEPEDTALCLGDKAPFVIYGGTYFKWYEYVDGQYVDPKSVIDPKKGATFISPDKTTDYRIVVSDSVWCYDTLATHIKVLPLPDVHILNQDDTVVKYGRPFQLLVSGARLYNWSPVVSLNNPNISYPMARPTEDTKYIVGGIGTNGCRAFDTLNVIVDKRNNIFIPGAFSPNGDGKNDIFRVTNLTFQHIMEFRVFNRQGLEVFSTTDSKGGWDGTYNGQPQDLGTYSYLIRVGYPDGFVETYKGEVTLIR